MQNNGAVAPNLQKSLHMRFWQWRDLSAQL